MPGAPGPPPSCRITFCIAKNRSSRPRTCSFFWPDPRAMRSMRSSPITEGFVRSVFVIEEMIASTRASSLSSKLTPSGSSPKRGNFSRRSLTLPIFFISLICSTKSCRSKLPVRIFSASSSAFFSSTTSSKSFIRPTMSPKPRMRRREALRPELLELVDRLAHADELDGLAGDLLDGERRAAARVAVELGEDEASRGRGAVELGGGAHRVLANHRVGDEEDVLRFDARLDLLQLAHHLLVDGEPAGGVVDHDVAVLLAGMGERVLRHLRRLDVLLVEDGDVELRAELLELLHRGGAVDVGRHQQRLLPVLQQEVRRACHGRRLPRALQARPS